MDTFDLRKYLANNRLLQPINEYNFTLSESLILEAEESGIDAKQGVAAVSKILGIDAQEVATAIDQISKAEEEGDDKEVERIQKELSEKLDKESLNEIGFTAGVAIASLIPKILEAAGRGSNWIKRNIPGAMKPEERKKAKEAISTIHSKSTEVKELRKKLDTVHDLAKQKPGPNTRPEWVRAHNNYVEIVKRYNVLKKEVIQLEKDYDKDYGAFYVDYKSAEKGEDGKPKFAFKGNALKTAGHKLHHLYMKPFKGILWALGKLGWDDMKDAKKREKAATIFYAIAMISIAGYGIASHLGHLHGIKGLAEMGTELADGALAGEEAAEALFALNGLSTKT